MTPFSTTTVSRCQIHQQWDSGTVSDLHEPVWWLLRVSQKGKQAGRVHSLQAFLQATTLQEQGPEPSPVAWAERGTLKDQKGIPDWLHQIGGSIATPASL